LRRKFEVEFAIDSLKAFEIAERLRMHASEPINNSDSQERRSIEDGKQEMLGIISLVDEVKRITRHAGFRPWLNYRNMNSGA